MINVVVLVGRLTKDIELRKSGTGMSVVSFTLACDRTFKSANQPSADFINCVAFNKTADLMAQYLSKGQMVGIQGRIQTRNYENQQGQRVYVTEVIADQVQFLSPNGSAQPGNNYQNSYNDRMHGGFNSNPYDNGGFASNNNTSNNYSGYSSNSYNNAPNPYQNGNAQANNPYASPFDESFDAAKDNDDDTYDIASDDLPF